MDDKKKGSGGFAGASPLKSPSFDARLFTTLSELVVHAAHDHVEVARRGYVIRATNGYIA